MERGKTASRVAVIAVSVAAFSILGYRAHGFQDGARFSIQKRADVIQIDTLKRFGNLERPAVTFLHDRHTDALEKKKKDCSTCHLSEKNRLIPKFKRLKDTKREAVMDIYHAGCMDCHTETLAAKQKSGPVICGECHRKTKRFVSAQRPMGFDKSLHYRHSKAHQKKCEQCHHEYDPANQTLYYAEGKEGTCRYCHRKELEENRMSMRQASHLSCIGCHAKRIEKSKNAGPVKCNGCHDQTSQEMIQKTDSVPRMMLKQPDIIFVKNTLKNDQSPTLMTRMNPVPFNHKAHETYNDTCRACHHESLKPCSDCHTLTGSKKGKGVKLEQAMHQMRTNRSCVGCHEINQKDPKCSGCHASINTRLTPETTSCMACHITALPRETTRFSAVDAKNAASERLHSRKPVGIFDMADMPEKVMIKKLADKYEPVEFPHRKIILTLSENIKENQLTRHFHENAGTLCQGCHHHSPPSKTPPRCGECHGKPFDAINLFKPGLMGAYHRQCMGCHGEMGIQKPDTRNCSGCHTEKKMG